MIVPGGIQGKEWEAEGGRMRRQWSSSAAVRNPRIVPVSRSFGGKDRHSKVSTVRGLRDRRIRLSVPTALQLYDLQHRLGVCQPSKVIEWLLQVTQSDIDSLPPLHIPPGGFLHSDAAPPPSLSLNYGGSTAEGSGEGHEGGVAWRNRRFMKGMEEYGGGDDVHNLFPFALHHSAPPNAPPLFHSSSAASHLFVSPPSYAPYTTTSPEVQGDPRSQIINHFHTSLSFQLPFPSHQPSAAPSNHFRPHACFDGQR